MSSEDVSADVSQHVAESVKAPAEKMLPQSEVNKLVAGIRNEERERAEAQYRANMQAQNQTGMGGQAAPQFNEEAIMQRMEAKFKEEREKERKDFEMEQAKRQVDELAGVYLDKMKEGEQLYPDFKEVTGKFNPAKYAGVTLMAARMDNLADIMYELNKNPVKLRFLHETLKDDPDLAFSEMTKLSQSIKRNEDAVNSNTKSPAPLSRLKTSATAGKDSGKKTITELRKQKYLKV